MQQDPIARPPRGSGPPPPVSPDAAPFELWRADRAAKAGVLFVCDHASNQRPQALGDLGLPAEDLQRHIAYDIGARGVTWALADCFDAPAVSATFSRLAIDPNRGEDDPTLVMRLYDGSIIEGNRHVDVRERNRRIEALHRPYHQAISDQLDVAGDPLVVSIHSFTPQLRGRPARPWHIGVLWRDDPETGARLLELLREEDDLCIGDNEPYPGAYDGDTMTRHAVARNLRHVVLEIRNDLISSEADQAEWAHRLAKPISVLMGESKSGS